MSQSDATIYAKPFSKNVTKDKVTEAFSFYGRVLNVELRKDESGSFRGSVFVTFADASSASSAVTNPPLQLGSSTEKLQVMLRSEYERKVASKGGDNSALKQRGSNHRPQDGNNGSRGHKRSRDPHAGHGSGAEQGPEPVSYGHGSGRYAQPDTGAPQGSGAAQVTQWQSVAEQREQRIKELEDRLRVEREAREAAVARANQALRNVDEAQTRERAASARLLAKEAETGSLKGEVASLRSSMSSRVDQLQTQYKEKLHDLEMQLQQLKNDNAGLKTENTSLKQRLRHGNPTAAVGDGPAETEEGLGEHL